MYNRHCGDDDPCFTDQTCPDAEAYHEGERDFQVRCDVCDIDLRYWVAAPDDLA